MQNFQNVTIYREDDAGETEITVSGYVYPGQEEVRYGPNMGPASDPEVEIIHVADEHGNDVTLTEEEEKRVAEKMLEQAFDPAE
jgi:hypothetical protein